MRPIFDVGWLRDERIMCKQTFRPTNVDIFLNTVSYPIIISIFFLSKPWTLKAIGGTIYFVNGTTTITRCPRIITIRSKDILYENINGNGMSGVDRYMNIRYTYIRTVENSIYISGPFHYNLSEILDFIRPVYAIIFFTPMEPLSI